MRESEERFKTLFEEAPDAMHIHSLEGKFIDGNKAVEELVGYKREELIEKSMLEIGLLPKEFVPYVRKLLAKSVAGEKTGPDEIELIRKDGKRVWVEINSLPIKIGGKRMMLAITRDITERKRADEERLKAAADKQRIELLERFARVAVGRELEIIELKDRIKELESKLKKLTGDG